MFPEYHDLIERLKSEGSDHRLLGLLERHEQLDQQISSMEKHNAGETHSEIEALKREKLQVKDEVYARLQQAASTRK